VPQANLSMATFLEDSCLFDGKSNLRIHNRGEGGSSCKISWLKSGKSSPRVQYARSGYSISVVTLTYKIRKIKLQLLLLFAATVSIYAYYGIHNGTGTVPVGRRDSEVEHKSFLRPLLMQTSDVDASVSWMSLAPFFHTRPSASCIRINLVVTVGNL
jgi:hypothetical protein